MVIDGVLYRRIRRYHQQTSTLQLIVPAVKKQEFVKRCHEGITGGHRAFRSTLDQVQRRGFWLGWRRDVARFCRQCITCSSYHRGHLPRTGPLQPMVVGTSWIVGTSTLRTTTNNARIQVHIDMRRCLCEMG